MSDDTASLFGMIVLMTFLNDPGNFQKPLTRNTIYRIMSWSFVQKSIFANKDSFRKDSVGNGSTLRIKLTLKRQWWGVLKGLQKRPSCIFSGRNIAS